jgi:hypothetical protein
MLAHINLDRLYVFDCALTEAVSPDMELHLVDHYQVTGCRDQVVVIMLWRVGVGVGVGVCGRGGGCGRLWRGGCAAQPTVPHRMLSE